MTGPGDLYKFRGVLIPWKPAKPWATPPQAPSTYSWHDGDTFAADVDQGLRHHAHVRVRCAGYNSPELEGSTLVAAQIATAYAASLAPLGSYVYLDSLAFEPSDEEDSFGRMLAVVTLPDGRDLAGLMLAAGQGVPKPIRGA